MILIYWIIQWTWGVIQNILGVCILIRYRKKEHYLFHGAIVTKCEGSTSMTMGMFIFMGDQCPKDLNQPTLSDREIYNRTVVHEYGHTIQSMILGPLFLVVIGISSGVWAMSPHYRMVRREKHISYYSAFQEKWANELGELVTKEKSMGMAWIDF